VWTSAKPLDYELYLDVDACGIFWHTSPYLSKRAGIPETTNRCSVLIDKVNALKQKLLYYRNNPDLFPRDRDRMIRCIIGHEFGHSIGMTDQYFWADFHLMSGVYWYRDTQRLIFEWPYDTTYSDSSKSEITVALKSDTVFYARIDTSQPPTYTPVYLPSSFMENQYESAYYAQMRVKNAISATSSVIFPAEPGGGYPGHTANVQGLSDTIKIVVELANYTGSPISLSGISAQNWFAPVLYDVNANVYTAPPLAEGSQVNYMFKRWEGVMGNPLTPPTELDLYENTPVLVYYLWNPPRKGPLRVVMNKTSNAPSNLYSLYGFGNVFYSITTSGAVIEDTINAYLACADRAWRGGDYSVGIYWANQILNLNPQSLVGYRLLNRIYEEMGDSLNQLATYDSLFAIMDRNGDPLVPPQAEWNRVWQLWYKDLSDAIKWKYWYFIRGLPRPFAM